MQPIQVIQPNQALPKANSILDAPLIQVIRKQEKPDSDPNEEAILDAPLIPQVRSQEKNQGVEAPFMPAKLTQKAISSTDAIKKFKIEPEAL